MSDGEESLLLRWSRRKAEARQGKPDTPAPAAEPAAKPEGAGEAGREASQEPAPAAASSEPAVRAEDLPDVETLTYESDFTAFLREGVPELIKRQALRKLWTSDPILANLDGLNDYDPISMKIFEELEGSVEPIAEISRGMHDKIMEAKRARYERKVRRRLRPGERRTMQRPEPKPFEPEVEAAEEAVEKKGEET